MADKKRVCLKCGKEFGPSHHANVLEPRGHAWAMDGKLVYCSEATPEQVTAYKAAIEIVRQRGICR